MSEQSAAIGKAETDETTWHREFADAALESLPGIFYLLDADGHFRHWNRNLEVVTGYSAEELKHISVLDLFEPALHAQVRSALELAFHTGRAALDAPLLTRFGSTRPYSYYGRLVNICGHLYVAGMGLDVSRLKQAQQAQAKQAQQLRHLAAHVPGVIYQLRQDGQSGCLSMPFASAKIFEVFGVRHAEVSADASPLFERIFADDAEKVRRAVEVSARGLTTFRQQFRLVPPGGLPEHAEWVEVESTPERLADGSTLWHGFARLITERRRMEEELTRLAYHDGLTGLPNRSSLQIILEERIGDAMVLGHELALLHLDLDNFKDINDVWGHSTGDRLLVHLARRLVDCTGGDGVLGRLGGDEFLVLVEGGDAAAAAESLAARLCEALDRPLKLDQRTVRVTGSIGISLFPKDGETAEDLLRHSDAALYRAKSRGTGSWARYAPELTAAAMARRYLETELRAAIESDEIQVALQPIVALASGQVIGYEALARWHHREDGWLDPEEFVALAERRGLIVALGDQVYRKALAAMRDRSQGLLALNAAPAQLREPDFAERLLALVAEAGVAPDRIEIEITERAFMEEGREVLRQIRQLREHQVSVAIDDFGTGYSSLAYLRTLPVQRLKIDQVFVQKVDSQRENAAIVKTVVTLAHELGLAVTAEGVQTPAEAAFVRSLGCEHGQGWYFGRGDLIRKQR